MSSDKQAMDKELSTLGESICDYLKFGEVDRGLDKIASSVIVASVVIGSMLLLSTSNIELNKFEIEITLQKIKFKPSTNFFARNYVLMASSVAISFGTLFFVADQLKK